MDTWKDPFADVPDVEQEGAGNSYADRASEEPPPKKVKVEREKDLVDAKLRKSKSSSNFCNRNKLLNPLLPLQQKSRPSSSCLAQNEFPSVSTEEKYWWTFGKYIKEMMARGHRGERAFL